MSAPTADDRPPYDAEGPTSEWKERMPRSERIARTFSAFANGVGGSLWVGVRDDGATVGVEATGEVVAELRRIAESLVTPPVRVEVSVVPFRDRRLVHCRVAAAEGGDRPVLAPGRDGVATAYVRDGASTRRAGRATLRTWERGSVRRQLDTKTRRVLRELATLLRGGHSGPTLGDLARAARMGQRAARRAIVELVGAGLATERSEGRYGLTPEGHERARRR
ncbi:MAG: ATP-binding protein [Planctomycetota bacterium]